MNCMAIESPDGVIVVDCGITFPREDRGVDIIHPVFDYLEDRADALLGIVITHGHEDHIGALPYLLERVPAPVYAPPYALALIKERMREFSSLPPIDLVATTPRKKFDLGHYTVEPLRVTHSIPDATALAIATPGGMVIHTGDFKLEDDPLDGEGYDIERFQELGDAGVSLLLSDSTNIDVPGRAGGEREVADNLRKLIAKKKQRVVVGIFPSNAFRLSTLVEIAAATGRRVCYLGRSVQTHARIAEHLNRLGARPDLLVPPERAREVPRGQLLVIASGTQAEPMSALGRLSRGEHPKLNLEAGDAVVFSSRTIPGNELSVWDLYCAFERRGMDVHYSGSDPGIHVSGHAGREEQSRMIAWTKPRSFIPVHGTFHHLNQHARLAKQLGVSDVLVIENGQTAVVDTEGVMPGSNVTVGRVHIDDGEEVPAEILRERAVMSEVGVILVSVGLDREGRLKGAVGLATRGVTVDPETDIAEAVRAVEGAVREVQGRGVGASALDGVRDAARRAARRFFAHGQRRPLVVVSTTVG
ncbi:MAG: ribonuclease J [Myxococcales bacterium]|nr:ribonuclease J [Myxococcales bacterium]